MKRYSFTAEADVPIEFDHPGRFFTLLQCVSPIDVSLQQGGAQPEVLESITPGIWADFGEKPFTRIRIVSHAAQKIVFLVSMMRSGWSIPPACVESFETDLSGLAASAFAYSPLIDLGEEWANATLNCFFINSTASAGAIMSIRCSLEPSFSFRSLAVGRSSTNNQAYMSTGSTNGYLNGMVPTGRYVRAEFQNGATIQGAGGLFRLQVMKNQP